ncbi:ferredoxin [Candidatus Poriferisocius sp.]|uniref:ferredoxin n=1 Tax=Candidatus Poriferisocius sp. TaxID=3101276 RepID=UPI003B59369B
MAGQAAKLGDETVRMAVDQDRCIGGGQCEMLEPEAFALDDETVVSSVIGNGLLPRHRAEVVVDRCPGRAITIIEDEVVK